MSERNMANKPLEIHTMLLKPIVFTVYGTPRPQGSKRSFPHSKTGEIVMVDDNENLKSWRQEMAWTAWQHRPPKPLICPIYIIARFYFARPKSVSVKKRPHMTTTPDLDKLQRALFDALTGTIIKDDSQVVFVTAFKEYGDPARVEVEIREVE